MWESMFFEGFILDESGPVRLRRGGSGPPLLLLHGEPQTHAMWHAVASRLAGRHTLICPDLSRQRSEATLAADMLALMRGLGHQRFGVAGHDLGGHVACRMALDAPEQVRRIAVLEIVPIPEHLNRVDMAYALAGYPSCWFAQLHPKPEALATPAPPGWFRSDAFDGDMHFFHVEAVRITCAQAPGRTSRSSPSRRIAVPGCPFPPSSKGFGSPARCWSSGAAADASAAGTTRCCCGRTASTTRSAAARSQPGTSWPKRRRRWWRRRCATSSPRAAPSRGRLHTPSPDRRHRRPPRVAIIPAVSHFMELSSNKAEPARHNAPA